MRRVRHLREPRAATGAAARTPGGSRAPYTRGMPRASLSVVATALLAAAAAAALVVRLPGGGDAGAQERAATVAITGLRINGTKTPRAIVRIRNCTTFETYAVHYTVQADNGAPLSLPAAGPAGATLFAG